jgi:hypothetical protein
LVEDTAAIRELHRAYAALVAAQAPDVLRNLFTEDAAITKQSPGGTLHVRVLQAPESPESITIAADRQSACARFHCLVQTEEPLIGNAPLLEIARMQGNRNMWWETGTHELDCVRSGDSWKIRRLVYRASG